MKTLAIVGDSHATTTSPYAIPAYQTVGPTISSLLRRHGNSYRDRTFGVGGERTDQIRARMDSMFLYDTPDIAVLIAGTNDALQSVAQSTIQANLQSMIKALKHRAVGDGVGGGCVVADQTALPATGEMGQRYVVLSDTSTTGGMNAWDASQSTTMTGSVSGQTVWEYRHSRPGEWGWGRIAVAASAPTACKRIVILGGNYLNFTTAGDTLSTPYAAGVTCRAAQQAAVAAENVAVAGKPSVIYVDLYAAFRQRIVSGKDPDFSATSYAQGQSWHVADGNIHNNVYGIQLTAAAVVAAIESTWLS